MWWLAQPKEEVVVAVLDVALHRGRGRTVEGIEGEEDQQIYTYLERTMSREDYAGFQAELESPATKMIMQSLSAIELRQEMMEV